MPDHLDPIPVSTTRLALPDWEILLRNFFSLTLVFSALSVRARDQRWTFLCAAANAGGFSLNQPETQHTGNGRKVGGTVTHLASSSSSNFGEENAYVVEKDLSRFSFIAVVAASMAFGQTGATGTILGTVSNSAPGPSFLTSKLPSPTPQLARPSIRRAILPETSTRLRCNLAHIEFPRRLPALKNG